MPNYLEMHQQVLEKLNATQEAIHQTALKLLKQADLVFSHNSDELSHPYILALIKQLSALTPSDLAIAIANHNNNVHSHPDIRLMIESMLSNNGALYQLINAAISAHNTSAHSHEDIRQLIAEGIGGSTVIRDMQNHIAALQAKVSTNTNDISSLNTKMTECCGRITTLVDEVEELKARVSALELKVSQLEGSLGQVDTLDMAGFTCNLPPIVVAGKSYQVTMGGLTNPAAEFDIVPRDAGVTYSKTEGIKQNEEFTVTYSGTSEPGSMKRFAVIAKVPGSAERGQRTISTKINSAPSVNLLTTTLPETLEPGKSYEFIIHGATDADGQAIKYSIELDPVLNINFTKTNNITNNEQITATVDGSIPRGTKFKFKITATDTLGGKTTKVYPDYSVNIAPDMSDLYTTLPTLVKPHDNKVFSISGAKPAPGGGSSITYKLAANHSGITFSKSTGITHGENVTMTVATSDGTRGESYLVTVSAVDAYGAVASVTLPVKINRLPLTDNITTTLPAQTPSETSINFQISGGNDPDEIAPVKYFIDATAGLSFDKTNNISGDDIVKVTVAKVTTETNINIPIYSVDSLGEKSATPKNITLRALNIVPHLVTAKPIIQYPTEGDMSVPPRFTMRISPYSTESSVQTILSPPKVWLPANGDQAVHEDFTLVISSTNTFQRG